MVSNDETVDRKIEIGGSIVEMIEVFCYLGSFVTSNSNCNKDC